jgi:hypothetical protein
MDGHTRNRTDTAVTDWEPQSSDPKLAQGGADAIGAAPGERHPQLTLCQPQRGDQWMPTRPGEVTAAKRRPGHHQQIAVWRSRFSEKSGPPRRLTAGSVVGEELTKDDVRPKPSPPAASSDVTDCAPRKRFDFKVSDERWK